jgi:hypothetical protein
LRRKSLMLFGVLLLCLLLTGCTGSLFGGGPKVDGPLQLDDLYITFDIIGTPEVHFVVTNTSSKAIKAFTVDVECWNAYGAKLRAFGFGDYVFNGISQFRIEPGETDIITWTLYGYDTAYKIKSTITSAIDVSDNKWNRSNGDDRYVREVTIYD